MYLKVPKGITIMAVITQDISTPQFFTTYGKQQDILKERYIWWGEPNYFIVGLQGKGQKAGKMRSNILLQAICPASQLLKLKKRY